jgi:hypothetical protein
MNKRRSTIWLTATAVIASLLVETQSAVAVESIPITATFSKIYRPDLATPGTCSGSSFQVARTDNVAFDSGDLIQASFYAYYPEDKMRSQFPVTSSSAEVSPDVFTSKMPTKVGGSYRLCVKDWQSGSFRPNFSALYVEVIYKMNYGSVTAGKFVATIPILPKDAEALAIEKVEKDCPFNNYTSNIVPEVSPATFKNGAKITWTGTYFHQGVPVPNHRLSIYDGNQGDPRRGKVKILGTSVTDKDGVFSFKFKFSIPNGYFAQSYTIVAERRLDQIGFIHGPIDSTFAFFNILCEKGVCSFKPGFMDADFIPTFQEPCLTTFKAYDQAFGAAAAAAGSVSVNFTDNKNLIAWIGRKVFKGSKNKVVFNSIYESEAADYSERDARNIGKKGSSGIKGRCYVSGYTTKAGKRVSGYYRSC